MPSSRPTIISPVMDLILTTQATSALDVGIGFGKWGFLLREYLDVWHGRIKKEDWTATIHGVEAFPGYVSNIQKSFYDRIYEMPIESVLDVGWLDNYDIVLMAEVLEHLDQKTGEKVLKGLWGHSKYLIVTTPTYESGQGEMFGNPYEAHKSLWSAEQIHEILGVGQYKIIQDRYLIYWARKDEK